MRIQTKPDHSFFKYIKSFYNRDLITNSENQSPQRIHSVATKLLLQKIDTAQEDRDHYYSEHTSHPLGNFNYLHLCEARARYYCLIQMWNLLSIKINQGQGLENLDDLKLSLGENLPEFNRDSIKLHINAHKIIISLLAEDSINPLEVSNSFHGLSASARLLYHRQMFHALNMELLRLSIRDTVESELATNANQEVEEIISSLPAENRKNFIEEQIEILKNQNDKLAKAKLLAFIFESHKINYVKFFDESRILCDKLSELLPKNPSEVAPAATQLTDNS